MDSSQAGTLRQWTVALGAPARDINSTDWLGPSPRKHILTTQEGLLPDEAVNLQLSRRRVLCCFYGVYLSHFHRQRKHNFKYQASLMSLFLRK